MQACFRDWQSADHMNGRFLRKAAVRQDRALILQLNSTTITRSHRRDEAQR